MYRLFIADDEKSVITGLQRNIKWEQLGIRICGTALSGSEAFSQIQKLNPDFALPSPKTTLFRVLASAQAWQACAAS